MLVAFSSLLAACDTGAVATPTQVQPMETAVSLPSPEATTAGSDTPTAPVPESTKGPDAVPTRSGALTPTTIAAGTTPTATLPPAPIEPTVLRIGLLPIIDTLPIHVADKEGLFREQGITVELQSFSSALARDAAMKAGALDGQLNDLISTSILNKDGEIVQIVRSALATNDTRPIFQILASPKSNIAGPADLKGKKIAISNNTVIDWATDQLLLTAGVQPADIQRENVVDIPLRLQLLSQGQVDAATLPEPLASQAINNGAKSVIADTGSNIGTTSSFVFTTKTIGSKPDAARRFLAAYEEAVSRINNNFDSYRDLMVERKLLREELKAGFEAMPFPAARVPSDAEVTRYSDWLVAKKIIDTPLVYSRMVNGEFLPK